MRQPFKWSDIKELIEDLDAKHQKCHDLEVELETATLEYKQSLQTIHHSIVQAFNIVTGFSENATDSPR